MKSKKLARIPKPSSESATSRMKLQKSRNTECELQLRSALHRIGLRFRTHRSLLPRRTADIVFVSAKVVVFVNGCFWHGCRRHIGWPKSNIRWWKNKIYNNVIRDQDTDYRLRQAGWKVVRTWEHDTPSVVAQRVASILKKPKRSYRRSFSSSGSY